MKKNTLKTRHAFLDTQVFRSKNFSFSNKTLERLVELSKQRKIHLYVTDITTREVRSQIEELLDNARPHVNKLKDESALLWNVKEFEGAFKKFKANTIAAELFEEFEEFCKKGGVKVISAKRASVADVFTQYFSRKAPFGDGKKKSEFPDAFTFSALDRYCESKRIKCYVISGDGDFRKACERKRRVFHLERIEEFIDLVVKKDEALSALAEEVFTAKRAEIIGQIKTNVTDGGFFLGDADGDVNDVKITEIELSEPYLIDVDDDYASFQVFAQIEYEADVSYKDTDHGTWDHEDNRWLLIETVSTTVEGSFDDVPISVSLLLDENDLDASQVQEVHVNSGDDFEIDIQPSDWDLK